MDKATFKLISLEDPKLKIEPKDLDDAKCLPGYPEISLDNKEEVDSFLSEDNRTPKLEKIAPYLWWMSRQSSSHIAPLHNQAVKFRQIVLCENPELHLIWYYNIIFIKTIPKYLLSPAFWTTHLQLIIQPSDTNADIRSRRRVVEKSALGFLRTYLHLIKYESDFEIAKEKRLVPKTMTWGSFSILRTSLRDIQDLEVTQRYHCGENLRPRLAHAAR